MVSGKKRRAKLEILLQDENGILVKEKEIPPIVSQAKSRIILEIEEENESSESSSEEERTTEQDSEDECEDTKEPNTRETEEVNDQGEPSDEVESESDDDSQPEIITFVDPMQAAKEKREKARREREAKSMDKRGNKRKVVEMEQITKKEMRQQIEDVKFKVQQYGLQGYTPEERRKRERARLIKLGAKAPKAEWKNYKVMMEEKKQAAIDAAEKKASEDPSMAFMTAPSLTKPKKIKNTFWSDRTKNSNRQSIGSWKGGQLSISKTKVKKFS